MDPQYLLVIILAMVISIVYSVWNYISKTAPGEFLLKRLIATIVFGIFIGIVASYMAVDTGMQIEQMNWVFIGGLFFTYSGVLVYINRGFDWFWLKLFGQKIGATK
jgi:hypothetical protein